MSVEKLVQVYLNHWLDEEVYECMHQAAVYGIIPLRVWARFAKLVDGWRYVEENKVVVDDAIGCFHVVAVEDEDGFLQLI